MSNIEYVESEKLWITPRLDIKKACLGEAILENLKKSDPAKVYEILHDSGSHVTVKEIHDQTITAAQNLLNLGVKKNDTVVFFTFLNLKITPLTFACYTIGAPVCFFETYLKEENVPQYLEMLDPAVIFYEEKFKSMVLKGLKCVNLSNLRHILSLDGGDKESVDELIFRPNVDIENFQVPKIGDPDTQTAILDFTSGSIGLPKIIILSHTILRESVYNRWYAKPGSVVMAVSDIRWMSQVSIMIQPAFLNVKRVYTSTPSNYLTGEFVKNMIDTHKVTHYFGVPNIYLTVLKAAEQSQDPSSLSSLKMVMLGGEGCGEAYAAYLNKITPNCALERCYGMSEMVGTIATTELTSRKNVNGGVLKKGVMMKIIDKNQNSLGPNQMGLICFKRLDPFLGYLKNNKANEETFIEGGWLSSGDLGMVDSDNLLNVFTREKHVLHYSDGKILMPNIIENIVNNFEGVHSSALVGQPEPSKENSKEDVGTIFVVFKNSTHSFQIENDLRDYLRKQLTKEQLKIIKNLKVIKELPMTTCFKVDRIALKRMLIER